MKREIIEVYDISKAIPRYKVWYKYYDNIFISVIHNNRTRISHLRIKIDQDNSVKKTDNKMCYWHSNWQYSKVEAKYGIPKTGNKTYEINKTYDGEIHRIDSLIENVAIEFQHTLEVSVNEMDSRYNAHKALNFIPYLILDLTDYSAKKTLFTISSFSIENIDYHIESTSGDTKDFLKKIRKWTKSKYLYSGNLFIDFSDIMIRFSSLLKRKYLQISQEEFLENILFLDQLVKDEIESEKKKLKQKIDNEKRIEKEKKHQSKLEYLTKVKKNRLNIENESRYNFYKKSLTHPEIKKIVSSQDNIEIIKHDNFYVDTDRYSKESHIYSFFQSAFSTPILELDFTLNYDINNQKYLFSEISLIKKFGQEGIMVLEFIWQIGKRIKKLSKKLELARGFLHSTRHHSKYNYDINEKLISKEYFLFNRKVNEEEFNDLWFYLEEGRFEEKYLYAKYKNLLSELYDYDEYGLIQGFCQNFIDESSLENYYNDINKWRPLSAINVW
jgi:hypothetical protein